MIGPGAIGVFRLNQLNMAMFVLAGVCHVCACGRLSRTSDKWSGEGEVVSHVRATGGAEDGPRPRVAPDLSALGVPGGRNPSVASLTSPSPGYGLEAAPCGQVGRSNRGEVAGHAEQSATGFARA